MADVEAAASVPTGNGTSVNSDRHEAASGVECSPEVTFKVIFNKKTHKVTFGLDEKVGTLKKHIEGLTSVPVPMMKLMYKGLQKNDEKTLREINVTEGCKMMVVGSTANDVLQVATPVATAAMADMNSAGVKKMKFCEMKEHQKVLSKGKPDDAMPGILGTHEKLPPHPLSGMFNKSSGKVRLTFKLETSQLWIGTKERTEKIKMSSINSIISEPIVGHEEYHIMAFQLGPTEASRYWVYWVPAQYIKAIKDTVLWQSYP